MCIFIQDICGLDCTSSLLLDRRRIPYIYIFTFSPWTAMERLRIDEKIFLFRFQESLDGIVKKPNFDRFLAYAG